MQCGSKNKILKKTLINNESVFSSHEILILSLYIDKKRANLSREGGGGSGDENTQ